MELPEFLGFRKLVSGRFSQCQVQLPDVAPQLQASNSRAECYSQWSAGEKGRACHGLDPKTKLGNRQIPWFITLRYFKSPLFEFIFDDRRKRDTSYTSFRNKLTWWRSKDKGTTCSLQDPSVDDTLSDQASLFRFPTQLDLVGVFTYVGHFKRNTFQRYFEYRYLKYMHNYRYCI